MDDDRWRAELVVQAREPQILQHVPSRREQRQAIDGNSSRDDGGVQPESCERPNRIRLERDSRAAFPDHRRPLVYRHLEAGARERDRGGHPADPTAHDEHLPAVHVGRASVYCYESLSAAPLHPAAADRRCNLHRAATSSYAAAHPRFSVAGDDTRSAPAPPPAALDPQPRGARSSQGHAGRARPAAAKPWVQPLPIHRATFVLVHSPPYAAGSPAPSAAPAAALRTATGLGRCSRAGRQGLRSVFV